MNRLKQDLALLQAHTQAPEPPGTSMSMKRFWLICFGYGSTLIRGESPSWST